MTAIVLSSFLGIAPRVGPRLLGENMGVEAFDVRAASGYLAGRPRDFQLPALPSSPGARGAVYRIVIEPSDFETWLVFTTANVNVVRAPLVNDAFQRYYWATTTPLGAWFNTVGRIAAGDPPFRLGTKRPVDQLGVAITSPGVSTIIEDRRYVHTYVDAYGSESQPSNPIAIEVKADETVDLTWDAPPADADRAPIERINIYRTRPGITTGAFFFVKQMLASSTSTTDFETATAVALNDLLPSTLWSVPPLDLAGIIAVPTGGFLAAFEGRNLYFTEPYRPHAWPPAYTLSVDEPIVGLGAFDNTLVILTTGAPWVAVGTLPESMVLRRMGPVNACLSRPSIVSMTDAVYYAGEEGLTRIDAGGQSVITRELVTREQWNQRFFPSDIMAVVAGTSAYTAFYSNRFGFELDLAEPARGIIQITSPDDVQAFNTDDEGQRPIIVYDDTPYAFAENGMVPDSYVWKSKEFFVTKPVNFGACQINGAMPDPDDYDTVLGVTKTVPGDFVLVCRLIITADGAVVYDEFQPANTLNEPFKLPSNFKAQVWQVTILGNIPISRVVLAETEKELATA